MLVSTQIPDREVEKIDAFVKSIGLSRAAFIRDAVLQRLAEGVRPVLAQAGSPAPAAMPVRPIRERRRKPGTD
jgi:hypothetical protein